MNIDHIRHFDITFYTTPHSSIIIHIPAITEKQIIDYARTFIDENILILEIKETVHTRNEDMFNQITHTVVLIHKEENPNYARKNEYIKKCTKCGKMMRIHIKGCPICRTDEHLILIDYHEIYKNKLE